MRYTVKWWNKFDERPSLEFATRKPVKNYFSLTRNKVQILDARCAYCREPVDVSFGDYCTRDECVTLRSMVNEVSPREERWANMAKF